MSEQYAALFSSLDQTLGDAASLPPARELEVSAEGHDPQDFVRVLIEQGQVTELRIVPAAAKQGNVELAELISAAVNDALVNYGAAMANALADRNPQLAGLQQQLAAVGARARAGMDAVLAESVAMSERIAEIGLTLSGEAGRDPDEDAGAGPE